ncbi:uncharacterized protein [Pyrus communis]|uniref:uncharacterized protein n=1 Tax=Pyrus communis TaxID=23211 RepID=UPI0035C04321
MANLAKLEFAALDITGKNYFTWVLDTKIHMEAGNLGDTIREESSSSSQDRTKAIIFIRRHLDETLKSKYNHQTMVILPRARYEWTHLRIQDFKSMAKYNSALFRITSQMKLCGDIITEEHMLGKTLSTFHASNNNELLMKNHHSQPTGSAPFPEVNADSLEVNATSCGGDNHKRGRDHKQDGWNRKGKNHGVQFHNQVPRHNSGPSFKNVNRYKGKAHMNNAPRNSEGAYHRCGGNGHWARTCRTPKHLVNLYQTSLKEKGVEINFLYQARPMNIPDPMFDLSGQLYTTHLDVPDFIVEREMKYTGPTKSFMFDVLLLC